MDLKEVLGGGFEGSILFLQRKFMIRKGKFIKFISSFVLSSFILSMGTTAFAQSKKTEAVVTLGANLTKDERVQMLDAFGVKEDEVKIINVTNEDIREQLGLDTSKPIPKSSQSISSSYVVVKDKGGINVITNNLTEVTGSMLANALLTSGVNNADVKADAPFKVTGTAALAGILKGFEDASGEELSLPKKEAAREEISLTNNLSQAKNKDGEELGKDEAAVVVNDIKTDVIKDKPKNDEEIGKIVNNVTNNYNIVLTQGQQEDTIKFMSKINDLDYNYASMKDSLKDMNEKLNQILKDTGRQLEESGLIEKALNGIKNVLVDIKDFIVNVFSNASEKVKDGITYDENGNIVIKTGNNSEDSKSQEVIEDKPQDDTKSETSVEDNSQVENQQENSQGNNINNK